MPQVVMKNLSREDTARLAPAIAKTVAEPIEVPPEWIVVEHADTAFFRGGVPDPKSAMVWIYWKKRTRELQKTVAKRLGDLLLAEGFSPVEVVYVNLDMDDFYEFKAQDDHSPES